MYLWSIVDRCVMCDKQSEFVKLPKLYRPVKIKFSSLRNGLGSELGVVFDIDTVVERVAMRIIAEGGWKWQIKDFNKIIEWDPFVEIDRDVLNEIGMCCDDIEYT